MPAFSVKIEDFAYDLPPERIAQYPLEERDASKLLCWNGGRISEDIFRQVAGLLPPDCMLVFNDTRVIRARLTFRKATGTRIEIFCLDPMEPAREVSEAFRQQEPVTWRCLIGNSKRWKEGTLAQQVSLPGRTVKLKATRIGTMGDGTCSVRFEWHPAGATFGEVLEAAGHTPLPPYISREDEPSDKQRYQTIYAVQDGSVAAPTAGLHFTQAVMDSLKAGNIELGKVTLHVGLGTFRPVSVPDITDHPMHEEQMIVEADFIRRLIRHLPQPVIGVGTTSVRTLESLYWLGIKQLTNPGSGSTEISQWDPYQLPCTYAVSTALEALLRTMEAKGHTRLTAKTRLLIMPGYTFRVIRGMITNFHQPRSTLLLLIAAFVGDAWKELYSYALQHDFRFLSYGDSCLLMNGPPR